MGELWWWQVRTEVPEHDADGTWLRTCHFGWSVKGRTPLEAERVASDRTVTAVAKYHGPGARHVIVGTPARFHKVRKAKAA